MKRSRSAWVVICLFLTAMVAFSPDADAQQRRGRGQRNSAPRGRAPTPPPPATTPPVIITKTDNSTIRGTILSATPDEITIQPAPRPGARAPASEPADDSVVVDWSDVLRVSNGLTRQKVLDEWKQQHKDELCETCHGEHTVFCTTCKGTGHDPQSGADCTRCKGALALDCSNAKCTAGEMPCPATCIKLTEGTWTTKPDGLKWRRFAAGTGFYEVSERHLGELIVREGNQWVLKGKCPTCAGKMEITCTTCRGFDKIPCITCVARKDAADCPNQECERGQIECATCKGTGLKSGAATPEPTASLMYDLGPQS